MLTYVVSFVSNIFKTISRTRPDAGFALIGIVNFVTFALAIVSPEGTVTTILWFKTQPSAAVYADALLIVHAGVKSPPFSSKQSHLYSYELVGA